MQKKLSAGYQNFEHTFLLLLEEAKKGPISMHTFLTALSGRGKILLLILLSLGFAQIPGSAMIIGPFISYLGIRIAMRKDMIWMPQFVRHRKIPSFFVVLIIKQTIHMLKFANRWSWPRSQWVTHTKATGILNGCVIACVGISLALCPPIPLTGMLASIAIFIIGIGLLNEDEIYLIIGYFVAFCYITTVFILLNYCSFTGMIEWLKTRFS